MRNRDLIGQKFNDLTVIDASEPILRKSGTKKAWLCRCDCGNEVVVTQCALITGTTKSCGCRNARNGLKKRKDLTGMRFGHLIVDKIDHERMTPNGTKRFYWMCSCDCGNKKVISGVSLINGSTISCGCIRSKNISKRMTRDLTGQKFGLLTVIEKSDKPNKNRHIVWVCKCDCGAIKEVASPDLLSGHTTSCGCLGASTGEYWIAKTLDHMHISYQKEFSFDDLVGPNGGVLRFDFAIFRDNKLLGLIEYQGEQHYKEAKKEFGALQRNITDPMKREYCNKNNIVLIEIAYSDQLLTSLHKALITLHANPVPRLGNE